MVCAIGISSTLLKNYANSNCAQKFKLLRLTSMVHPCCLFVCYTMLGGGGSSLPQLAGASTGGGGGWMGGAIPAEAQAKIESLEKRNGVLEGALTKLESATKKFFAFEIEEEDLQVSIYGCAISMLVLQL